MTTVVKGSQVRFARDNVVGLSEVNSLPERLRPVDAGGPVHFHGVAVGVGEIDADGVAVAGDALDGDAAFQEVAVERFQLGQAFAPEGYLLDEVPAVFPARAQLEFVVLLMAILGSHEDRAGVAFVADGQPQHVTVEGLGPFDVVDRQAYMTQ